MSVYLQDSDFTLYNGDALEVLRTLPDESVHMCVTSPPFYGLRDYGTGTWEGGDAECDHVKNQPPKPAERYTEGGPYVFDREGQKYADTCAKCGATRIDQQIGLEETPEQWVQKLVEVFREVRRVLRKDGTLWLEVGDSYVATQGGRQHAIGELPKGTRGGKPSFAKPKERANAAEPSSWTTRAVQGKVVPPASSGLKPKDLIGAPWLLAFALRADGWYLRSDIVWSRPNPMPESVTDRPTKSHSYVFLLSKSARYFFDQEAVRETASENTHARYAVARETPKGREGHSGWDETTNGHVSARNVRSVWNIATQPYPEAHFATYPEELVRRCILAGTSERGCCPECGAPWVREVEHTIEDGAREAFEKRRAESAAETGRTDGKIVGRPSFKSTTQTLGWHPSCDCVEQDAHGSWPWDPRPCTVLDPFSGSGTTALVARKHGRRCIGIELSADYCALTARRLQQLSLLAEA